VCVFWVNSEKETEDEGPHWDFSDTPPLIEPKPKPPVDPKDTDWLQAMKPATKAQRKATRIPKKKKMGRF